MPANNLIVVTPENVGELSKDYPFAVRQSLKFGLMLERGRLDIKMPNGPTLRFQGAGDGPEAVMVIYSLDFAKDLASGGEVGISEAFIKGHWESPNLT
ncbi:MAG: cyclopropane-fatty-acyl-phospholipid synthase, partial [Hyphomicrobiales bacterium]|nr:cyclopropane-fatty-acyl-phospholipid synthase [Hyphomicrobiales bacterium]